MVRDRMARNCSKAIGLVRWSAAPRRSARTEVSTLGWPVISTISITVRAVAAGLNPKKTCVGDAMTARVRLCRPGDSVDVAAQQMSTTQIRRMPVLDDACHIVGIVSLGDLATRQREPAYADPIGSVLRDISWPSQPDR